MRALPLAICLLTVIWIAVGAANASTQSGYTFMNVHYSDCNDLELDFAGNVTAATYTGGANGTNFPAVSGLGTSHIVLSGATMSNPGYSQYLFTFPGSPAPSLNSCRGHS
jgi:hypothetical protein